MAEEQMELDCYHKAEEGEPKFTLLARDPSAGHIVRMWAFLRIGNVGAATQMFGCAIDAMAGRLPDENDRMKVQNAHAIGSEMHHWRNANR